MAPGRVCILPVGTEGFGRIIWIGTKTFMQERALQGKREE